MLVRKLERPDDDLRLGVADNPALVRLRQDELELVFSQGLIGEYPMPKSAQDPGRHAFEDAQERSQNQMNDAKGAGENQQILLGVSDGEKLGHLLSQNDVQHGHHQECGGDPDRLQEPAGLLVCQGKRAEQPHHRVLGKPAYGEAGGGDADLRQRKIVADPIDDHDCVLGRLHTLSRQFLEASPAHAYDGEFRRNPYPVEENQGQNRES